jgi:tetratricopeptide (TPR) repeat protein
MTSKTSSGTISKTSKNKINNGINIELGRIVENYVLIWLDSNIKEKPNEYYDAIDRLHSLLNTIVLITDEDKYFSLIEQIKNEKLFVIISGAFGENLAQIMESNPEIHSVYVYCGQPTYHKNWAKKYRKVKGVFTSIPPIYDALRRDVRQANNDLIPVTILPSTDLDKLDQPFICSSILKEVLINSEFNKQTAKEFIRFCREYYKDNSYESNIIDEYKKKNEELSPIQWYTRECFIYSMLNRALRLYDMEILTLIIFFVQDLHKQIKEIHAKSNEQQQFTVYHGQGLSNDQFLSLQKSVGGLISFNTFLFTTIDKEVSLNSAQQSQNDPDIRGVLFKIEIDSTRKSYPFVILDELDYHKDTDRHVLFSLNAVFRIKRIRELNDQIFQVDLILCENDDKNLKIVNENIEKKFGNLDGFLRLAQIMIYSGENDQAKKLYEILLDRTSEQEAEKLARIHYKLGHIDREKKNMENALDHYIKSYEFQLALVPKDDPSLCQIYIDMGIIEQELGHFDQGLKNFWTAVSICRAASQPNLSRIAFCLFNIGLIFHKQKKYSKAHDRFEEALVIQQANPSPNNDLSAKIYSSLSMVFVQIDKHELAIKHALEASEIAKSKFGPNDDRTKMYENDVQKLYQHLEKE